GQRVLALAAFGTRCGCRHSHMLEIHLDRHSLVIPSQQRAGNAGTGRPERPGIPGAAQIDAKAFDLLAETLETCNVELSALEQGGRGLSLASLTMPCQQRLPDIQVELRHAATHVQSCTSPQICRTATQHQLTAAVSPVASRCLERQRGKVAV